MAAALGRRRARTLVDAIVEGRCQAAEKFLHNIKPVEQKRIAALNGLLLAIQNGSRDMVEALWKYADLTATTGTNGYSALHYAVASENLEMVKVLLEHSRVSDFIDTQDNEGRTALHLAASCGLMSIMVELLDSRADIDATDFRHQTPLHVVVIETQDQETIEFLLDNEAEVNTKDAYGDSPLHSAVALENPRIVKELLEYGADPDIANVRGKTPRDQAETRKLREVCKLISDVEPHHTGRPTKPPSCTGTRATIAKEFRGIVRFYYEKANRTGWYKTVSVYDLVYGDVLESLEQQYINHLQEVRKLTVTEEDRQYLWKWIHFPATNVSFRLELALSCWVN